MGWAACFLVEIWFSGGVVVILRKLLFFMDRKDYAGLRSLRGIGAILIFYHHFGFRGPEVQSFGDLGVSLFFMLSGLVLSMSRQGRVSDAGPRKVGRFIWGRVIKIYPLYLLSLIPAIRLWGCPVEALPADLLLLQSWVPDARVYFSGNAVSWFLSSLFFCYAVFLPLQKLLDERPRMFTGLFAGGLTVYFAVAATVPEHLETAIIYVFPVMELPVFIIGMLIWHFMKDRGEAPRVGALVMTLIQLGSIGVMTGCVFCYGYVDQRWALSSYWWLPDILLLVVMIWSEDYRTPINRVLHSRLMRIVGAVSFVVYLYHTIIIDVYKRALASAGIEVGPGVSSVVCLTITLAVSWALHIYIELPLAKRLKA